MEDRRPILLEKANGLPLSPGVYIMKNRADKIIYVGKSKVLRQRVSQYFQDTYHDVKTTRMISSVYDFQYMLCDSEMEALTLENRLIKLHKPKYNIRLKDSKSYPYIKLTMAEPYPRIVVTRRRDNDRARYFGPYSGAGVAYAIVKTLQQTFRLPSCRKEFPRDIGKERPCLYYRIGQCMGPCTGKITPEDYRACFGDITDFLRGSFRRVRQSLEEQMLYAAEHERYEAAAVYRDRIRALEKIRERQKVVGAPDTEQDIIALYQDELCSCITVFYVRDGAVTDSESFPFPADTIMDQSAFVSFLCDLYTHREYIPRTVLISEELDAENRSVLDRFLAERASYRVDVHRPQRGENRAMCAMVYENARQYAAQYRAESEKDNRILVRLAELLALEVVPERIEAFDISNMGNDAITAGLVVCENAKFKKSDYRVYSIRGLDAPDDYESMRQAVRRRLSHPELPYPDLFLLDGGRGHVAAIRALLTELGIDIPVFGMVKDQYHKTRALSSDTGDISIARDQAVFTFIYKLQEEVHRFTISRMSNTRSRAIRHTSPEQIPGIGPAKAAELLRAMGTLRAIGEATAEELQRVKGISRRDAEAIVAYFQKKNGSSPSARSQN